MIDSGMMSETPYIGYKSELYTEDNNVHMTDS